MKTPDGGTKSAEKRINNGINRFKFNVYNALEKIIRRSDTRFPGATATLLLECFIEDAGRLQSHKVVSRGICEDGCFSDWRDKMVKDGWLVWNHSQTDKGQYYAGRKLIPYINREIQHREILAPQRAIYDLRDSFLSQIEKKADTSRVHALEDDVKDLRAEMNEIKELLAELNRLAAPPPDKEKQQRTGQIAQRLNVLLQKN